MTETTFEHTTQPLPRPAGAPPYLHVMAQPAGAICNLDCQYCFFLSKDALYPGSSFRMSDEVLEAYIRQIIEAQQVPQATIAWQGGEPTLMGLDFFQGAMDLVKKHARPGMNIDHSIQTNGILLDDAWCQFFAEHQFLVGLSLDGPREMHDAFRRDKGSGPTFDKVLAAARLLQKHGVVFNILCTVHAANGDHPLEVYRFFRDEVGVDFIQFIPIIERATAELLPIANRGWGDHNFRPTGKVEGLPLARSSKRPLYTVEGNLVTERSVTAEQWGQFLIAIFDEWVRRDVGKMYLQLFESALGSWVGPGASLCIHRETCGDALALEHTGDLYSCDYFVEPSYYLGNITEEAMLELAASDQQRRFGADKRDTLPRYCRECPVLFACNGGCPRNRFITSPPGEDGLNYLCAGYKAFFTHVDRPMRIMAELLQRGLHADKIMEVLAAEDAFKEALANARPDDPCPCGSGKVVEQCHGPRSLPKSGKALAV